MINTDYLYSTKYTNIDDFIPISGSTYLYAYSPEGRSRTVDLLINKYSSQVNFIEIKLDDKEKDVFIYNQQSYNLRSSTSITSFFVKIMSSVLYIDISGLNNRISASLLKNLFTPDFDYENKDVKVIYIEPQKYNVGRFKQASVLNDLSEQIEGIEPLPGFASIIPDGDEIKFIALLGFEGGRFTQLIESVQPPINDVIPIIGVPGYRAEYPFVALWGNRHSLESSKIWHNIKYAAANSMVDVYILLNKILAKLSTTTQIKIAPIGTKPHAMGAILFAIKHPKQVEIIYDNPKRKIERTLGIGTIIETSVCKLLVDF